jgi:two-component system OmpR family response regulator
MAFQDMEAGRAPFRDGTGSSRDSLIFGSTATRDLPRIVWADPTEAEATAGVQVLRRHGFDVRHVGSAAELRDLIDEGEADLILLEVVWPDDDGLSLCKDLTEAGAPPVIIYSASTDSVDCITGLEFGADDFVCKSAHPLELLARVRALMRRLNRAPRDRRKAPEGWRFYEALRCVIGPSGKTAYLSATDAQVLRALIARPKQVVSRAQLLDGLEAGADVTARAVDTRVTRLRRALNRCDGGGFLIKTLRGGGYALAALMEDAPDGAVILRGGAGEIAA